MDFKRIWSYQSLRPITLNDDNVYFAEDRVSYSLSGGDMAKSKLFHFEEEDLSLIGPCRAKATAFYYNPRSRKHPSCFVTLTKNNLFRHCNKTGTLLDSIYLGNVFSFKLLDVNAEQNMIVIQSVCFNKFSTKNTQTIQAIILISIQPFKLMHHFELTTSTVKFDVRNVRIFQNMLMLSAGSCTRIFSMDQLIESGNRICSCDFGQNDCDLNHGLVGRYPNGIPINFVVSQLPEMLVEVRSDSNHVSFGCIPVCILFTPSKQEKTFSLMRVSDQQITDVPVDVPTIFDECSFHPRLSNVIVYLSNHSLSFFKYRDDDSSLNLLLRIKTDELQNPENMIRNRNVNRPVRTTAFAGAFVTHARTLFETKYDFSTDLHLIRATSSDKIMKSSLFLYTTAGQLIREIKLPISLQRGIACNFSLSLDKLAIVKHEDGVFHLRVYQLQRRDHIQAQIIRKNDVTINKY